MPSDRGGRSISGRSTSPRAPRAPSGRRKACVEVYGIDRGFQGLMEGRLNPITLGSVGYIVHRGGTILQTARSEAFKTEAGQEAAVGVLRLAGRSEVGRLSAGATAHGFGPAAARATRSASEGPSSRRPPKEKTAETAVFLLPAIRPGGVR
ncbi:6-phosphofructokinase, partial [Hydrogenibacillus schlegelii]